VQLVPEPGTRVRIRARHWHLEHSRVDGACVSLRVRHGVRPLTFIAPFDRIERLAPETRWRRARRQQARARLAALVGSVHGWREPAAAVRARIDICAYQLEPALAVIAGWRRLLIADEVGLGKTVEAGLIIAEQLRRDPETRVLLVVPAPLGPQWAVELDTRFRCPTRLVDRAELNRSARSSSLAANPWSRSGVSIVSFDYLKQPHVLEGLPLLAWDLLIVDEAHEAAGHTVRHAACHRLARQARHVVLLTATPHSGDHERFSRLIGLGAHGDAADNLLVFRRTRAEVGHTRARRVRWRRLGLSPAEEHLLDALGDYEQLALRDGHRERTLLLLSVFRKRALSTTHALAESLRRRLEWLSADPDQTPAWTQPTLTFESDEDEGDEDDAVLRSESGLPVAAERAWIERLIVLAEKAALHNTKVRALDRLVTRAGEPVLVFTEFRDSLDALGRELSQRHRVALLHGQQRPHERTANLQAFMRGDAQVLLTTDVACQGLNLQHAARWVLCVEVPWNPVRLEQRIGRVDRIGQARPVHATILLSRHCAESPLLSAIATRALTAQRVFGASLMSDTSPPAATQVAASVLTGAELPPAASIPDVPLCRAWQRTARAAARVLARRRQFVDRWRGAPLAQHRVRYATGVWRQCGGSTSEALLAFAVPLVDGNGSELARDVIILRVRWRPVTTTRTAAAGALTELRRTALQRSLSDEARRRLERRRRRVMRLVAAASVRAGTACPTAACSSPSRPVRTGTPWSPRRWTRGSAGWSACPVSRAAPAPPRCRTWVPTGWRSRTCSSTSTCTTGAAPWCAPTSPPPIWVSATGPAC
jgi:superfamily II DNA or RNA helicase